MKIFRIFLALLIFNIISGKEAISSVCNNLDPISTIRITYVDPYKGEITITNFGLDDVDVSTFWLCFQPAYTLINNLSPLYGGDFTISGGQSVSFLWSSLQATNEDGELALYSSNAFSSSSAVEDYFQWGEENHGREDEAVNAGVWIDDEFQDEDGPYYFSGGMSDYGVSFWTSKIPGCTYPLADNYDVSANFDDGSCTFTSPGTCIGDADSSGTVNVLDLVAVSSNFGSVCP